MIAPRRQRKPDDQGAILILAILIITVVALVTGAVLTRGDGSLRATVQLRDAARSSYAADAAAQVALNGLRTGHNVGSGEPDPWFYTNAVGTGCFGFDGVPPTSSPKNSLELKKLIPQAAGETQQTMSARVECESDNDTGEQGSAVPINNQNKPGYAIVTLGGPVDATGTKDPGLLVKGGIYANGAIKGKVDVLEGGVRATGSCDAAVTGTPKNCNVGTPIPDPDYPHELGSTVPPFRKPPTTCTDGYLAVFEPGYYDSASEMNAATNLCRVLWFKPGNYYFDFHNDACSDVCPSGLFGTAGNTWRITGQTVVGGTPLDPASGAAISQPRDDQGVTAVPGACRSPITDVNAKGVQFVFGGSSRMYIDQNSKVELCATYHGDRPPIEIYGLKTGSTPAATSDVGRDISHGGSIVSAGSFVGATVANLKSGGAGATWTTANAAASSSTLEINGFAPSAQVPAGSILTGATLRIAHREPANGNNFAGSAKLTVGGWSLTSAVAATTTATTTSIPVTGSDLAQLQAIVRDNGYTGASVKYTATAKQNNATTTVGPIALDLTYYLPVLRGQAGTCIDGSGTNCKFMDMKNGNNKALVFFQGTTYVPAGDLQLLLGNFASEIMKFGVVARQLEFQFWNGNSVQDVPVIEIPDDSPGFGFETTLTRLNVYVCPGNDCSSGGELALKVKAKIFDDGGTPGPPHRQVSVLSWSHTR